MLPFTMEAIFLHTIITCEFNIPKIHGLVMIHDIYDDHGYMW